MEIINKDAPGEAKVCRKHRAKTPERQEQYMIGLAMKQAERMLEEGTAPSQIVVHFLRLATENSRLQNERLKADTTVSVAKAEVLKSQKHYEELYEEAIKAFKSYGGGDEDASDEEARYYD